MAAEVREERAGRDILKGERKGRGEGREGQREKGREEGQKNGRMDEKSCHTVPKDVAFLLLDLHIGIEKEAARKSAGIVFAVSIPLTLILLGVLL